MSDHGLAFEREWQAELFAGPDAREEMAAYVQKRPAKFGG